MKKHIHLAIAVCVMTTLLATSAFAWRSVRTGQKNFERAWSAYVFKRPDQAKGYFAKAAAAFGSALAETPPSRTTMFTSNLTMAGISFYSSGQYQQCITTMEMVADKDDRMWEAPLYSALSHARLGDATQAIKSLKAYLDTSPGQPMLSNEAERVITELDKSSGDPSAAAITMDTAIYRQISNNIKTTGKSVTSPTERCNGTYWWRYNQSPCTQKQYIGD